MHIQTHIMSGWCVADTLELTPRERFLAMVASSAADLDGLGLLVGRDYYERYHHVIGHNLLVGVALTGILTAFSTHRLRAGLLYLGLFHLHLVLDYFGSGPGWTISYLWPFSDIELEYANAWSLTSWQNFVVGTFFLIWMIVIVVRRGRTPLEVILPSLDAKIVERYKKR